MPESADILPEILVNEPMSKHTSIGVGGPAERFVEVGNVFELGRALRAAQERGWPLFFLGAGSNLLVSDAGIAGLVVHLAGEFEKSVFTGDQVRAGAGVFLPTLVKQAADRDLSGIEPLVGVPGTVGGALIMNAGTRELEIGEVLVSAEVMRLDGQFRTLSAREIDFGYRTSSLQDCVVCFGTLQLQRSRKDDIIRTIQSFLSKRLQTQPIGTLNLGSVFKNPEGDYAGSLIERCGLKGLKIGQVQISEKHANFIVNRGGATAKDAEALIFEIQRQVAQKFGVKLETEVKLVGRPS